MIITKERAIEIAQDAFENAGCSVIDYVGYYTIWKNNKKDFAITVNKAEDEGVDGQYYAIFISSNDDEESDELECWWDFTNSLDVNELANKIIEIAYDIQKDELNNEIAN